MECVNFDDDTQKARNTLREHAYNLGWRPTGGKKSRNPRTQVAKDAQQDSEATAVRELIEEVAAAGRTIHWLGDYYEAREGGWIRQDADHYRRLISRAIASTQGGSGVALVGRTTMNGYLDSLRDAVMPPCVDTALLDEKDRLENIHLDTGQVVPGAAFQNGIWDGGILKPMHPRWFCTTSRPYPFPEQDPGGGRWSSTNGWLVASRTLSPGPQCGK